jgi:hypothetical protein
MSSPISSSLARTGRSPELALDRARHAPRRPAADRSTESAGRSVARPFAGVVFAALMLATASRAVADDLNDYPTSARADYVFGCMKANGETREILDKCSCSIDVIASIIPYDSYVSVETILSMSQVSGPVGSEFRQTETAKLALQAFRRAQAEAEVRCF